MKKVFIVVMLIGVVIYGFADVGLKPLTSEEAGAEVAEFVEAQSGMEFTHYMKVDDETYILKFDTKEDSQKASELLQSVIPSDSYTLDESGATIFFTLDGINEGLEIIYLLNAAADYLNANGDYESVMTMYGYIYEMAVEKTGDQDFYDALIEQVEADMLAMGNPGTDSSDLEEPEVTEQKKPETTEKAKAEVTVSTDDEVEFAEIFVIEIPFAERTAYEIIMNKILKDIEKQDLATVINSEQTITSNKVLLLPVELKKTNDIYLYGYQIEKGDIIADLSYLFYEEYKWKVFLDYNDITVLNKGQGKSTVYLIKTGGILNVPIDPDKVISGADLLPLFGEYVYEASEILVGIDKGVSPTATAPEETVTDTAKPATNVTVSAKPTTNVVVPAKPTTNTIAPAKPTSNVVVPSKPTSNTVTVSGSVTTPAGTAGAEASVTTP